MLQLYIKIFGFQLKQFQILVSFINRNIVKLYFKTRLWIYQTSNKIETFQKPIKKLFFYINWCSVTFSPFSFSFY